MRPERRDFVSSWLRCFAVQGSWNYRTLVGGGIAYAMLPLLRRIHAGDPVRLQDAVARNMRSFNGHPYLCPMAVAALARLELEEAQPETVERFRAALRGPLGTVGDRAIWAQWRPFCLLLAIVAHGLLGFDAVASVVGFLVLYNAGHVAVRTWAFRRGWRDGLSVGSTLRDSWIERAAGRLWLPNLLLLGVAVVLVALASVGIAPAPSVGGRLGLTAVLVLTVLGAFRWPSRGGRAATSLLVSIPLAWLVLSVLG